MSRSPADDSVQVFEPHRRYLVGVAYRMLGSLAEAEDTVQDAFVRWQSTDRSQVREPRAFLTQVVARLALDRLKSAQARREQYVGTWLPEPIVEPPTSAASVAEDLSMALLLTLERLSPLERAAFLLHDVFDMDYAAVAKVLERSEVACRQLVARAREHVRSQRARFEPSPDAETRLVSAFLSAAATGDVTALANTLADDAVFYSDGGGKRRAALNPIFGRDRIVRFLVGVRRKDFGKASVERTARINGMPGVVIRHIDGGAATLAFDVRDGRIAAIYMVSNPDKLRHLS
jgi:RNA polymerase sigma-70 factor (ECF subfamily)